MNEPSLMPQPRPRRHSRQQLVLKVEFEDVQGFRAAYLSDLSEGGLRIETSMEVGQRFVLNVSFLGLLEPVQLIAEVQWSLPASAPGGPASGLAFVDMTPEARAWLFDILDSSTVVFVGAELAIRVVLLEAQPFLREIYGQEVRNWAELRDEEPLELVMHDTPSAWLDDVTHGSLDLAIMDVDDLDDAMDSYRRLRFYKPDLALIAIGSAERLDPFLRASDEQLICLNKPLRFGLLMNTVRIVVKDRY